jgi:Ca-activated chloride channel family protein
MHSFACAANVVLALHVALQTIPYPAIADRPLRATVNLVVLHVSVVDQQQRFVTDLRQSDFEVFEDGRRQALKFFQPKGLPLAVSLVLDTSGSMEPALPVMKEGALRLIRWLRPRDTASIITFDDSVRILQDWTTDRAALETATREATLGQATTLYTAAYIALTELEKYVRAAALSTPRRGALILFSDGEDSASPISFDELLKYVRRTGLTVYAVRLGRNRGQSERDTTGFELRRLAEQTGGRAFFPRADYELARVYESIGEELASQYVLAYESDNLRRDDAFRSVTVLVSRQDAAARTRRGYVVPR